MSWTPYSRWHLDPPDYDEPEPDDGDDRDEYDVPDHWWGNDLNEHLAAQNEEWAPATSAWVESIRELVRGAA